MSDFPKNPDYERLAEALRVVAEELDAIEFARIDYMIPGARQAKADADAVRALTARYRLRAPA
jgi:hypothetical protein